MMPSSTATRTTSNCCTGRQPSSPDSFSPRPARSPASAATKDTFRSKTASEVNKREVICNEDIEDGVTSTRPMGSYMLPGDIAGILERELSDSEGELDHIKPQRSSHTLKVMTDRLKKHLSIDSALAKRHSRSTIGTSEEEVERRAELRRIRDRRIQEELGNKSIYDDDATSLSTIMDTISPVGTRSSVAYRAGNCIPLPSSTPPVLYPGSILLDLSPVTIQAEADQSPTKDSRANIGSNTTLPNYNAIHRQGHNSPSPNTQIIDESGPTVSILSGTTSSIPDVLAVNLEAKQLPVNIESDSVVSPWRFSFASEQRGEILRKLSHGNTISTILTAKATSSSSKIEIGSPEFDSERQLQSFPSNLQKHNNLEATGSHSQTCCGSTDFGGIDGSSDEAAILHTHRIDISPRLTSKVLHNSGSWPQVPSLISDKNEISTSSARNLEVSPASVADQGDTEHSDRTTRQNRNGTLLGDTPRLNLLSLFSRSKSKIRSNAEACIDNVKECSTGSEEVMLIEGHNISIIPPGLTPIPQLQAIPGLSSLGSRATILSPPGPNKDESSPISSETSSFREREEELRGLQLRFSSRRALSSPVSSKFREEFDRPDLPSCKPSVLTRLARLGRRSYDGTGDGTVDRSDLLESSVPIFDESAFTIPSDDTENIFSKTIKSKEGEKERKKSIFGRSKGKSGKGKEMKGFGFFTKKKRGENSNTAEDSMAIKELVIDSWEMEMEATAAKAKTKSRNIVKKSKFTKADYRFPASWSRFPSHERKERVYSASARDNIEVKDFANLGVVENGNVLWCLAHDDEGHHTAIDGLHRKKGIGERLLEKVEKELYEFDTQDDQRAQTNGRRGSLTVGCELEYPELEILPLTLMDQEEMEKHEEKKEEFRTEVAKNDELDEIAKLLGAGFDGVMSRKKEVMLHPGARDMAGGSGSASGGASEWEDEAVMSSSDERDEKPHNNISDPRYYADCVVTTKSTLASPMNSPCSTPHSKFALRTDILESLRIPTTPSSPDPTRTLSTKGITRIVGWTEKRKKYEMLNENENESEGSKCVGSMNNGHNDRNLNLGTVVMRKSTDDLIGELVKLQEEEKHSLLKAVDDAFGRSDK